MRTATPSRARPARVSRRLTSCASSTAKSSSSGGSANRVRDASNQTVLSAPSARNASGRAAGESSATRAKAERGQGSTENGCRRAAAAVGHAVIARCGHRWARLIASRRCRQPVSVSFGAIGNGFERFRTMYTGGRTGRNPRNSNHAALRRMEQQALRRTDGDRALLNLSDTGKRVRLRNDKTSQPTCNATRRIARLRAPRDGVGDAPFGGLSTPLEKHGTPATAKVERQRPRAMRRAFHVLAPP